MSMGLKDILGLAQYTLQNPRRGLRMVLNTGLSRATLLSALALMAVLAAILTYASAQMMPITGNPLLEFLMASPLQTAVLQAGGMMLTAILVHVLGRAWGGQGQFDEALLAVIWLQVFMLVLQLSEVVSAAIGLPQLGMLAAVVSIAVFPWLLTMFVSEVHGFTSPLKVFLGILVSTVALSFVLSFLLVGILGPEAFTNV